MPVSADPLPDLAGKDKDFYAGWLRAGILCYLFGVPGRKNNSRFCFPGAEDHIGCTEFLFDDLAGIARLLAPPDLVEFEKACGQALTHLDLQEPRHVAVAEVLVRLSAQIGSPSVVVKLACVANCYSGLEAVSPLFHLALEAAAALAEKGNERAAESAAHIVRTGPSMPSRLARVVLLALCRALPENVLGHLQLLFEPLEQVYGFGREQASRIALAQRRRRLIHGVAERVPFDAALRRTTVEGCRRPVKTIYPSETRKDWWAHTLLNDADPAMMWLRDRLGLKQPSAVPDFKVAALAGDGSGGDALAARRLGQPGVPALLIELTAWEILQSIVDHEALGQHRGLIEPKFETV